MRALAVLTVRNEGAFLLEWLAHHRAVGFTDFLILSNDCDDGSDAMLDRLETMGAISHLPNPAPHEGGVQWAGLKRADAHPAVAAADWILTLDIDEFVNIHAGDGTLPALLAALPEADAITLTWRLFGNPGVVQYVDRPMTGQFLRAAPAALRWPWRAFMFKTLFRNDGSYAKLGVHRPRSPSRGNASRWFDGAGQRLPDLYRKTRMFSPLGVAPYGLVQLNHYPLGAMESFIVKADRGRAVHGAHRLGLDYWAERNWCDAEDKSIARMAPVRDTVLAGLMADPELARLHADAVAWRHKRFAELMGDEANRALMGRLMMTPPARALAPNAAHYLYRFTQAAGPDAD